MPKICPFRLIAFNHADAKEDKKRIGAALSVCNKELCAWWIPRKIGNLTVLHQGRCAIMVIGEALTHDKIGFLPEE